MDKIANLLLKGQLDEARRISTKHYPFKVTEFTKRSISKKKILKIFFRDGFIDRYSGEKLYHPAFLRMLHEILPDEFPFHKNGKKGECHDIFWDKLPSIDHIIPIYKGGTNEENNLATTSMKNNLAKNNSLLNEIGWQLKPKGNISDWDGCTKELLQLIQLYSVKSNYIKSWSKITIKLINELELNI